MIFHFHRMIQRWKPCVRETLSISHHAMELWFQILIGEFQGWNSCHRVLKMKEKEIVNMKLEALFTDNKM